MRYKLENQQQKIEIILELVTKCFNGNAQKTSLWFNTENPLLSNISPNDMISIGRHEKLHRFIKDALAGEAP